MSDHTDRRAAVLKLLEDETGGCPSFLGERFPHVLQRIIDLWGKPQMAGYFDGLLSPAKSSGAGFPEQARREIETVRAFHDREQLLARTRPAIHLPVRETLREFLEFEQADFPVTLENEHPLLLQEILSHLGTPRIEPYLDTLLGAGEQFRHGFSEQALIEIMTIKAHHRARHGATLRPPPDKPPSPDLPPATDGNIDDEHVASLVFDRIQRW